MRAVISRKIDNLGRIVLPKELRRLQGLEDGTAMDIFVESDGSIILRKSMYHCAVCGRNEISREIGGVYFCADCIGVLKKELV